MVNLVLILAISLNHSECDDFIENVENLLIEEKERVELLEHELHEESVMRASLE